MNMQGQMVYGTQLQNTEEEILIPVSKLTSGMYFILMHIIPPSNHILPELL